MPGGRGVRQDPSPKIDAFSTNMRSLCTPDVYEGMRNCYFNAGD